MPIRFRFPLRFKILVALLFLVTTSVTYGIVHDHRGAIQIENEPGQGANFVLTFPVAEGALPLPGPAADVRSG